MDNCLFLFFFLFSYLLILLFILNHNMRSIMSMTPKAKPSALFPVLTTFECI